MSPPQTPQRQIVTATSFKFPITPISPVPGVFSLREGLTPTSEPAFPPAEVATLLKSKSFAVKDGTFNPIELQTVKDYIEVSYGDLRPTNTAALWRMGSRQKVAQVRHHR